MNKLLGITLITGFLVVFGIYGYNKWFVKASGNEISIEKDNADALNVNIDFGVGDLLIRGNSPEWVSGEFTYTHKKLEPRVKYKKQGNVGTVDIKQGSPGFQGTTILGFKKPKYENEWDLQLTNDIPIDLDVDMGVSTATLDLKGIQLSSLSIDGGVGESVIDLSGNWSKGFRAKMDLGVGDITIILPKETGVRVNVSKGIGTVDLKDLTKDKEGVFVNDAYANADVIIDISLDIGVGDVKFKTAE
ncbi:toast rack family protein [Sporosarcina sp. ACRSL]|uniref:toast rack family protein n=1 Tax=Sporosarcina sp. ACRSL TaxID=2918215 RepID=UPI001EF73B3B|nr:toast rack family protein [Sporosarcina sp. ACRSL]MCG7343389.1 toast rack family protein [Sporosarcina sp. ACRSL]